MWWQVLVAAFTGGLLGSIAGLFLEHHFMRKRRREEAIWHNRHERFNELIRTAGDMAVTLTDPDRLKPGEPVQKYQEIKRFAAEFCYLVRACHDHLRTYKLCEIGTFLLHNRSDTGCRAGHSETPEPFGDGGFRVWAVLELNQ